MAAVAVLVLVGLPAAGPTLVTIPGWGLFVTGLLAFSALIRYLGGDRVVHPGGEVGATACDLDAMGRGSNLDHCAWAVPGA